MGDPPFLTTLWERHPWLGEIRSLIEAAAASHGSILLRGASPRMCEIVARTIHVSSPRRGSFIPVNCAAFAPLELEHTLFGGHVETPDGRHAEGGGLVEFPESTVYVNEIADMPVAVQARFLQVLQDRRLPRDTRLIAATNQDLDGMVARGQFLADLYAEIKVAEIPVPPLTEEERRLAEAEELEEMRREWARREPIDAHNEACRALAMTGQRQGLVCPYCGRSSPDDIEFVDYTGQGRKSFFVCRACGRSFGHEL